LTATAKSKARDRAGEDNRLRDRERHSYGGKGKGILKLRSIEMAIKLVARPRHGQYEHNKSPLTQCEAVNGQWSMANSNNSNNNLLTFIPNPKAHHNTHNTHKTSQQNATSHNNYNGQKSIRLFVKDFTK